jgi:YD repeat-containing protein
MLHYLLSLLCCFLTISAFAEEEPLEKLIPSTPDQLAALTSEPDYLIGGVISPLGGQPLLRQTDLVVKGAQNIALTRIYIPPYIPSSFPKHKHNQGEYDKKHLYYHLEQNYKGWQFLPHLRLEFNPHLKQVRLSEPSGATLDYLVSDSQTTLASPHYAISNVAAEQPSGRYDSRNTRISFEDNKYTIVVHAIDGSVRSYRYKCPANRATCLFCLEKETLPNGKVFKYRYDDWGRLLSFESLDPQERYVYASVSVYLRWSG